MVHDSHRRYVKAGAEITRGLIARYSNPNQPSISHTLSITEFFDPTSALYRPQLVFHNRPHV
jgi:hypothetical protein